MTIRDFRDFVAWQLSYQLKCEVFEFTAIGRAARDFKYRDQIRDSSASTPRNISLEETQNSLIDARDRAYLEEKLFSRLWNLSRAANRATKNLKFYLESKDAKKNYAALAAKNPKRRLKEP